MADWSDEFRGFLTSRFGVEPDNVAFLESFGWVEDLHTRASDLLSVGHLEAMPAHDVYAALQELSVPRCPISVVKLGKANDAEEVRSSLVRLMSAPGNLREKYTAAKIPQAGMVTVTELLCLAKPARFVLRNTAFTRAAARVIPFYTKKALDELEYEDFLDLCRELVRVQETYLKGGGLGEWARKLRFLLLYAILTEK